MLEFTWPRVQQDAAVSGGDLWITASISSAPEPAAIRFEVLCEEIGGAQPGRLEVVVVGEAEDVG